MGLTVTVFSENPGVPLEDALVLPVPKFAGASAVPEARTDFNGEAVLRLSLKVAHKYQLIINAPDHVPVCLETIEEAPSICLPRIPPANVSLGWWHHALGITPPLALHSPTTWWPIEQDYHIDDLAFARPEPVPPRVDLKTGAVRVLTPVECNAKGQLPSGGAATALDLPLNPSKELKSLTLRAFSNELIIGLMAVTLAR